MLMLAECYIEIGADINSGVTLIMTCVTVQCMAVNYPLMLDQDLARAAEKRKAYRTRWRAIQVFDLNRWGISKQVLSTSIRRSGRSLSSTSMCWLRSRLPREMRTLLWLRMWQMNGIDNSNCPMITATVMVETIQGMNHSYHSMKRKTVFGFLWLLFTMTFVIADSADLLLSSRAMAVPGKVAAGFRHKVGNQSMDIDAHLAQDHFFLVDGRNFLTDDKVDSLNWGSTFWPALSPTGTGRLPPAIDNEPYTVNPGKDRGLNRKLYRA